MKPLRPCRHPGCCELVADGYCGAHKPSEGGRRSEEAQSWRWMYQTAAWQLELRANQLLREPFCRVCAKQGLRTPATDVDHVVDHKGNWARFSDPDNLESMCHSCHSRKTARDMWQKRREKHRR